MSFREGRYLTLSGLAHDAWTYIASGTDATTLRRSLPEDCLGGASSELPQDVDVLLRDLERRHLIELHRPAEARRNGVADPRAAKRGGLARRLLPRRAGRMPGRLTCLSLLCALQVCLWVFGLRHVLMHIFAIPEPTETGDHARTWLAQTADRIERAGIWYPFEARCLERSLCLLLLGRLRGIAVDFRLGVLPAPFLAHAWVEHDGAPVNDTPEHLRTYVAFPPIGPEMVA